MSAFGKFLIVLNLLAAVAFAALLVLDYRERDAKYVVTIEKANRVIDGDPLANTPGAAVTIKGKPIPVQEDDVRKAQSELKSKIEGDPIQVGDLKLTTPLQKLAWASRPFARTFGRREALNRLMGDPNPDPDKFPLLFDPAVEQEIKKQPNKDERLKAIAERLQKELDDTFTAALTTDKGIQKRLGIAHVLFCVSEALRSVQSADGVRSDEPYLRYDKAVTTIGLETAIHEVETEISTLKGMVYEAGYAIDRDREAFMREHEALLRTANALADELKDAQNLVQSKQAEYELAEKDRKQQDANVKRITDDLAEARRQSKEMLDKQTKRESDIFAKQTELRNAVEQNRSLELLLRELEAKVRAKEEAK